MGRSCRCSAPFYKEDSSLWASVALEQPPGLRRAPVSAAFSADESVDAVLVVLFDDELATAAAKFPVGEAAAAAAASGLAHVVHPLKFPLALEDLPFGSVGRGLPFWSAREDHPFGLEREDPPFGSAHEDPPFGSEHEGLPCRMVCCWGSLVAVGCLGLHC